MLSRIQRLMPDPSFLRKLSVLATGSIVGQSLVIISSPLLTRFFSPDEFGTFAAFVAILGILGAIIGLGFELCIASSEKEAEASLMISATSIIALFFSIIVLIVVWLFGHSLAVALKMPALVPWLWLLGPAAMVWGIGSALSYWSIRHGRYRSNAINRTLQLGTQAGSQVALGFLQTGAPGLIGGYLLGYVVRIVHYTWNLPRDERHTITRVDWRMLLKSMKNNWRYPVYVVPSTFLQTFCQLAPALLIAILYSPAIAGLYALSQRIIGLPVQMLSQAASKVFLGEARDLRGSSLRQYFKRTTYLFAALALIGSIPIIFFAPSAFEFIFGQQWREAGVFIQLLAPLYLVRFVVQPISQILYLIKRQEIYFIASIINTGAFVGSFGIAYMQSFSARTTILLFSVTSSLSFIFTLACAWLFLRGMETLEISDGKDLLKVRIRSDI